MVQINTLFVVHTTSRSMPDARTDANFELQIVRPGDDPDFKRLFPDLPHNEREAGRTDCYRFDVSKDNIDSRMTMYMEMVDTNDGWLPSSLFVIGIVPDGTGRLLGTHPRWPNTSWFDRNDPPYLSRQRISDLGKGP